MTLSDLAKYSAIQWYEASRGLSATAELLVGNKWTRTLYTINTKNLRSFITVKGHITHLKQQKSLGFF